MNIAALEKNKLDLPAFELIRKARDEADYDQPLFDNPQRASQLLDLAREAISFPSALPSNRSEAYNLYAAFDHIIENGLWKDPKFKEFTDKLLSSEDPKIKALFVDCIHESKVLFPFADKILEKNPNLLSQILNAAQSTGSEKTVAQAVGIFMQAGFERVKENEIKDLISAIKSNPSTQALNLAACFFARHPDPDFTQILHANFGRIDFSRADDLVSGDQPILRYLLNHSPSSDVVKKTQEIGLNYRTGRDAYTGSTGLLELALYLEKHRREFGLGISSLFDRLTNRRIGPGNYSEEAALRFIVKNLKYGQFQETAVIAYEALGSSQSQAVLKYLDKSLTPPGFWGKLLNTVAERWSDICDNTTRLNATLAGLRNNPSEKAKSLIDKIEFNLDKKPSTNLFGW